MPSLFAGGQEYVGIDLHKKSYLLTETGEVMERRIRTEPQQFAEVKANAKRRSPNHAVRRAAGPRCSLHGH